ncbi:MAG: antitoxin family protein [Pirellulales bacterium]
MQINGHYENGMIVPHNPVSLPNGTEVTIIINEATGQPAPTMSAEARDRYHAALARIDALPSENPGDAFSGVDHDRVLYGD